MGEGGPGAQRSLGQGSPKGSPTVQGGLGHVPWCTQAARGRQPRLEAGPGPSGGLRVSRELHGRRQMGAGRQEVGGRREAEALVS